jgi:hypothetical protein
MGNRKRFHIRVSRRPLLLALFTFAALSVPIRAIAEYTASGSVPYSQALRISGLCYAIGLAALLFIESEQRWTNTPDDRRPLEVIIALVGLGVSIAFLIQFAYARVFGDLRYGLLSAIASGTLLIHRRTDKIRALAFALMSVATVQSPLVSSRPPFISLAVVCGAAAAACLLPVSESQTAIRRLFSPPSIVCMFLAAMGLYEFNIAWHTSSKFGLLVSSATVFFFGVGTVVIVMRGTWAERHSRR